MRTSVLAPLQLTARLWWRHWPTLFVLVLAGFIADHWLLDLAAGIGVRNHVLGLCALSTVVLVQLVVVIAMFHSLRPSLRVLGAVAATAPPEPRRRGAIDGLSLVLAPFFAYYAAWGLLGDSVRQYSLRGLEIDPFGEHGMLLDALHARGIALVIAATWLLRWYAKRRARDGGAWWQLPVTLCEASWLFIGLFALDKLKDRVLDWWHARVFAHALDDLLQQAAAMLPTAHGLLAPVLSALRDVGLYALLPLVWLALAAMIFGRAIGDADAVAATHARLARLTARYRNLPALPKRIGEHFVEGYRKRLLPVADCVRLTLRAGGPLLVLLCVGYRALDWLALWGWIGATRLIGAHALPEWQLIGNALGLVLVDPLRLSPSLLVEPLRICLLAAVLETTLAAAHAPATDVAAPSVPAQA